MAYHGLALATHIKKKKTNTIDRKIHPPKFIVRQRGGET